MNDSEQARVAALLRLFEQHNLEELVIEQDGFRLHLRRDRRAREATPAAAPRTPARAPRPVPSAAGRRARTVAVRSPLIGIFYLAHASDAAPFVAIGDVVREGQTVCIVEAMKVFNEIKSDWPGRVIAIPAQNGKLVQAGEPLVVLEFLE